MGKERARKREEERKAREAAARANTPFGKTENEINSSIEMLEAKESENHFDNDVPNFRRLASEVSLEEHSAVPVFLVIIAAVQLGIFIGCISRRFWSQQPRSRKNSDTEV